MAFAKATDLEYFGALSSVSLAGKIPVEYGYKTEDAHTAVDAAGYFNELSDTLRVGDIIRVYVVTNRGASNEAISTIGDHVVVSNASGVVDTSNVNAYTLTDSD